jgi:hypothetical protein
MKAIDATLKTPDYLFQVDILKRLFAAPADLAVIFFDAFQQPSFS